MDQFTRDNYLAVALLLILGVRKGELVGAMWREFDFEEMLWDIPAERSKTGVAITVPLSNIAIQWLQELQVRACGSAYVFPNRRRSKRFGHISPDTLNSALAALFGNVKRSGKRTENRLGAAGIEHFTIHDLRRTLRTLLASVGTPSHIAERCLNHKLKGIESVYNRHDYLDERREALQKISDLVSPFINSGNAYMRFQP